jgi:hypothetical protein
LRGWFRSIPDVTAGAGDVLDCLPFDADGFDLGRSSLAIHNISAADDYRQRLAESGMADVAVRDLGWRVRGCQHAW